MTSSPTKESMPHLAAPNASALNLNAPPSPRTHRVLRRLQSAHALGASARNNPTLSFNHNLNPLPLPPSRNFSPTRNASHAQSQPRNPSPTRRESIKSAAMQTSAMADSQRHTRARSNSDASVFDVNSAGAVTASRRPPARRLVADTVSLDRLIRDGPPDGDVGGALESTRLKILDQGVKSDADGMSTLRIYVWLILLNAPFVDTDSYLALIHRGASPAYSKIRNDTFRTLATDPLFRRRVSEASLIRLLNAVAWNLHDVREERTESITGTPDHHRPVTADSNQSTNSPSRSRSRAMTLTTEGSEAGTPPGIYVQGMNVLAAPFLYAARSEAEAFAAFHRFITFECPGYVRGAMDGVHKGLALVDKVLAIVDPKLSAYLLGKGMHAELYAFPSVLTLCACTPPLPEVLRLWDFLFAYGPHLNILCIVAQLVILRTTILSSPSPTKVLRSFPPLQAELIKEVTLSLIKKIPDSVYAEIVMHAK